MYSTDKFVSVFGNVPAGDDESLARVVADALKNGFAIVLDKPGDKVPMCVLTSRQRKEADVSVQTLAREAGDVRWASRRHECGLHHALTVDHVTGAATPETDGDESKVLTKVSQVLRRITKELGGRTPNIGVELGRSRMIVVDVDTTAERDAFERDWTLTGGGGIAGLTVRSPGVVNQAGEWVHKNGGHYWFTIPDGVELPSGSGSLRAESGWVAMWSGHQVLVPPSVRKEGPYELIGQLSEAPAWLIDVIMSDARTRSERMSSRVPTDGTKDIDIWAASLPWADLLEPDGWTSTGLPDTCGCPIWTAPGSHASRKSATAHDLGCDRFDTDGGHAPLKVWTDNPPEWLADARRKTGQTVYTKLTYEAWRHHEGNAGSALKALGMHYVTEPVDSDPLDPEPPKLRIVDDDFDVAEGEGEDAPEAEPEDEDSWKTIDLSEIDDELGVEPELMMRSDGTLGLLYPGLIHSIHGESESGKSWIAQWEVANIVKSGRHALFVDFENDAKAVKPRFRALGVSKEQMKLIHYKNPEAKPDKYGKWWESMFEGTYAIAVLDGVTDALGLFGKTTKDNDEISTFLRSFPRRLARSTGAAVVLIDHVVKSPDDRGRWAIGGQSKMAGLDGAAYSVDVVSELGRGKRGELRIQVGKDKPGYIREHSQGFDAKTRLADIAVFVMDATGPGVVCSLDPPAGVFEMPDPTAETETAVLHALAEAGDDGLSGRGVEKAVSGTATEIRAARRALVECGDVSEEDRPGSGGGKIYKITEQGTARIS